MLEHFGVPSSAHDMRLRKRARSEAIDGLAGRTVWCSAAVPERRSAAEALRSRLSGAGAVATGRLDIAADGPLRALVRQLDTMLGGHAREQRPLDAKQQESLPAPRVTARRSSAVRSATTTSETSCGPDARSTWVASCTRDRRSRCAERRVADRRAAGSPTVGLDACAL